MTRARDPRVPSPESVDRSAVGFFRDRFGLDERALSTALGTALERQVEYADLFFEYSTQDSVALEEGIVKSGSRHLEQGVGVRAQRGERQGYAHSDEISVESVRLAAATARAISDQRASARSVPVRSGARGHDLYPVIHPPTEVPVARKIDLLGEIDAYARGLDPRVQQVMASVVCQHRHVLVADSDGGLAGDVRPLVRLNVQVIVADGTRTRDRLSGHGRPLRARAAARAGGVETAGGRGRAPGHAQPRGGSLSGRHDGRRARAGLAGHPAARSDRPRTRGRLQPQEDLGVLGPHRPAGRGAGRDRRRRRDAPGATRLAQRRRRGHADPAARC